MLYLGVIPSGTPKVIRCREANLKLPHTKHGLSSNHKSFFPFLVFLQKLGVLHALVIKMGLGRF